MNYGLSRLDELPLSLRLIREIHSELLKDGRGAHATPGDFRATQNWIGPAGAGLAQATFVPPPVPEMKEALAAFESFLHADADMPMLFEVGLAHAQFETIHPFLDGNGRLGRLLLVFFLIERGRLSAPLLYLSAYLERDRQSYYDALQAVSERGDAIPWVDLFLTAVQTQAADAVTRAHQIAAQILTRTDQVAQRLDLGGRHDDRSQLPGREQPGELQRVTRIGLDGVAGLTRDRARRADHHLQPSATPTVAP